MRKILSGSLNRKFFSGAMWGVLGTAATYGSALLISIGVARILGVEQFGRFILLQTTVTVVGIFAGLGLGATAARYIAALRLTDKPRLSRILHVTNIVVIIFAIAVCALYVLFAKILATQVFKDESIYLNLVRICPAIFLLTVDGYLKNILLGFENSKRFAICSFSGAICSSPAVLLGAYYFGLEGASAGLVVGALIQSLLSYRQVKFCFEEESVAMLSSGAGAEIVPVLRYAVPTLLSTAMVMPAHWICQAILLNKSNAYTQTAILGVAMQWFYAISFLPNSIGRVALPMFSRMFNAADSNTFSFLRLNMLLNGVVCLPMVLAFWLVGERIAHLYGQGFAGGATTLLLAAISATLLSIQSPLGFIFAASARMWESFAANLVWAIVYVSIPFFSRDVDANLIMKGLIFAYIANFIAALFLINFRRAR